MFGYIILAVSLFTILKNRTKIQQGVGNVSELIRDGIDFQRAHNALKTDSLLNGAKDQLTLVKKTGEIIYDVNKIIQDMREK